MASDRNNCTPPSPAAVVMVPLPLQGHLNQLLHLSRLVSNHNIPVHFVSTSTHCRQAKLRVQGWDPLAVATIHFHEFQTPCIFSPPPNPNSINTTKFPSHLQPLCEAATHLRQPVASLLRKLSATTRRLVIIHDSLMGSVIQDFVSLPNTESYTFHSVSAFTISLYTLRTIRKQIENLTEPQALTKDHLSFEGCFTSEFKKYTATQHEYAKLNSGRIYNSCSIIEKPMLDLLENEERNRNKKFWALGPFNPVDFKRTTKKDKGYGCLKWLDKQESNTVIFVSFGTTTSFTKQQITELAIGLEKSGHKFIWALRDADKSTDVFSDCITRVELPKGYEERIKGRGLVVREWAPQLEILAHRATGGFMSHCGWNSCMESISMGVPIVAWPIHSDQPTNTVLVTEILKVGLTVKDWECRDEIVVAEDVEKAVRKLMGTKEGAEIRRRAVEMGGGVRRSVREGGVSWLQLQSFIAHITR